MSMLATTLAKLFGSAWHTRANSIHTALGHLSGSGSPNTVVTPDHIGQMYFDNGGSVFYQATGLTNTDWTVYNALTGLLATAAEINRAADASTRIVNATSATLTCTELAHDGKTITLNRSGGIAVALPAATGSGTRLRFVVGTVSTTGYVFSSVVGTDLMEGIVLGASTTDSTTDAVNSWLSGATDDTVTLDGTTTGGAAVGDWLEFEDISATGWAVRGMVTQSGTEATPFSDAVA